MKSHHPNRERIDHRRCRAQRERADRRGLMTFELLLAIPILLVVLIGGIQINQMLMANQAIQAAATNGAREASMPGTTESDVRSVVRQSIAGWRFEPNLTDGDISIEAMSLEGDSVMLENAQRGDIVTVSIEIDAIHAVPDFLVSWGFSIMDRTIGASALFRRE